MCLMNSATKREREHFSGNLLKFKLFYCGIREKVPNTQKSTPCHPPHVLFPFVNIFSLANKKAKYKASSAGLMCAIENF